jgi:plastocyanin
MRTCRLIALSTMLFVVVGAAAAKTVTVTVTKNGYVPSTLSIVAGDTVAFTNGDTVAHQIQFKQSSGFTCTPNPLVLQPSASASCVFQTAGSYSYSDPNVKGNTYRGSVTVTAPPDSVTVAITPPLVAFGGKVVGSGTVSTQRAGENVDVLAQQCGTTTTQKLLTAQTTTGGAYTFAAAPSANTTYTTKLRNATSSAVLVRVKPGLKLTRVAAHRYSLRAVSAENLAGKYVAIQRYNATKRRWVALKLVPLKVGKPGVAPAIVTTAVFRSTLKTGLRMRATMTQAQVGTCYAPALSTAIRS